MQKIYPVPIFRVTECYSVEHKLHPVLGYLNGLMVLHKFIGNTRQMMMKDQFGMFCYLTFV